MTTDQVSIRIPISRITGLILTTVLAAWIFSNFDADFLARLASMSSTDLIKYERDLHTHTYAYHFVTLLLAGGAYLSVVELFASIIGYLMQRVAPKAKAPDDSSPGKGLPN